MKEHQRKICADLNVTAIQAVLHGKYTKFCCFYCERYSRSRDCHYRINNVHYVQKQQRVSRMLHILL